MASSTGVGDLRNFHGGGVFSEDRLPTLDEINIDYPSNHGTLGRPRKPLWMYDANSVVQHLAFEVDNALAILWAISRNADNAEAFEQLSANNNRADPSTLRHEYCVAVHTLATHIVRCLRVLPYFHHKAGSLPTDVEHRFDRTMDYAHAACDKLGCEFQLLTSASLQRSGKGKGKGKGQTKGTGKGKRGSGAGKKRKSSSGNDSSKLFSLGALWYTMKQMQWQLDGLRAYNHDITPKHVVLNDAIAYIHHQGEDDDESSTNQSELYAHMDAILHDLEQAKEESERGILPETHTDDLRFLTSSAAEGGGGTPDTRRRAYTSLDAQVEKSLWPELQARCQQACCAQDNDSDSENNSDSGDDNKDIDDWWLSVCYALWCTSSLDDNSTERRSKNMFEEALSEWM